MQNISGIAGLQTCTYYIHAWYAMCGIPNKHSSANLDYTSGDVLKCCISSKSTILEMDGEYDLDAHLSLLPPFCFFSFVSHSKGMH